MKKSILAVSAVCLMPLLASATLYNLQLNGYTDSTMSGAAQIGSAGDVWNNPAWDGIAGSTTLISTVGLVDSSGAASGVFASMTATYNNNTTDWNDGGVFNHYSGQTGGSATPVLMDRVVKVDYSGSVNVMTLSLSGLTADTAVTVYAYGAGTGAGQGGEWSLNGGASSKIEYDGSATGRDVTLASSQGLSWEVFAGTTDGSGNLTITATGPSGGNPWWQTYMNGVQIDVVPEPATLSMIAIMGGGMLFIRRRFMI